MARLPPRVDDPATESIPNHFTAEETIRPMLIGFELAAYNFLSAYNAKSTMNIKINLQTQGRVRLSKNWIDQAHLEARAIQIAHHLVNLPPNDLNPNARRWTHPPRGCGVTERAPKSAGHHVNADGK